MLSSGHVDGQTYPFASSNAHVDTVAVGPIHHGAGRRDVVVDRGFHEDQTTGEMIS